MLIEIDGNEAIFTKELKNDESRVYNYIDWVRNDQGTSSSTGCFK